MPKCLTHEQVKNRFLADLQKLCDKHGTAIWSDLPIAVSVKPVYNKDTGLYEEYGADFDIGDKFPKD